MKHLLYSSLLLTGLLSVPVVTEAKIGDLLPVPKEVKATGGVAFALGRQVAIADTGNTDYLKNVFLNNGCTIDDNATATAKVKVEYVAAIDGAFNHKVAAFADEAYELSILENEIVIKALNKTGVIRAAQTLQQLAEGYDGTASLEALTLKDWPAFKVRGFMHDVGRSFVSFPELKKELALLARFKVNVFHWHLTEKLAWRFEVKAYPQLTKNENMIRYPGSYYTQEQCKELVKYADSLGITVIPEIDMPGHSDVFAKAMGFNMQSDQGVEALKKILDEVCEVFKGVPYIHIGGDEVNITYPNFLQTMSAYVRDKGVKVIMWNPLIGQNRPTKDMVDMTQMWSSSGKVIEGVPNIDCRYNYTNHFDVYADLVGIYKSNIYYEQRGTDNVAGTISAPWNDTKVPDEKNIILQNNFYANVLASAERAWKGGGKQYVEKGGTTLPLSGEEYDEFADFERRLLFHKSHSLSAEPIPYVKQTNVRWRVTQPFPNGGNNALALPPEVVKETSTDSILPSAFEYQGHTYGSWVAAGAGIYLRHIWHPTVPSFLPSPANNQTVYAWTYVYSPKAQEAGAQIEFYTYSRSGTDVSPLAGQWDRRGSKIWVNGEEIAAPTWDQPNVTIHQDNATEELKNENLTARPVTKIQLKEGWNKVFMRLPHVNSGGTKRDKWQFTFVLTDTEGKNALDGITYSPSKRFDTTADKDSIPTPQAPKLSTAEETHWYTFMTPLRNSKYPTSQGVGQGIVGSATVTEASKWKFEKRTDGTFNIVNKSDGSYVSPTATNNTQLKTSSTAPAAGWEFVPAATDGYFILKSGTTQFNQTNNANFPVYNWGGGSNTTDTGCQYQFTEVDIPVEQPKLSTAEMTYWYQFNTPLRGNKFPTSKGAGEAIVGETTATEASTWKFVDRTDGTFDIVNKSDGTYVSPDAATNTALKTSATKPATGWKFLASVTTGYFGLINGTAQFYQTHATSQNSEVYNWGDGTNTNDTGCQYAFALVAQENHQTGLVDLTEGINRPRIIYDLQGRRVAKPGKGVFIVNGKKVIY